jgi:hypothetical protein
VIPRWIDGAPLTEGAAQPGAVAVVIDNAPEARPQSGLADAPIVFEVPVEGGRTRFLAVFPTDASVAEVGPVRSARPYLLGLAHIMGAPLTHVGGSPDALTLLRQTGWAHVDQYYDPPFRRVTFRHAPFNVYTSIATLVAFAEAHHVIPPRPSDPPNALWSFRKDVPPGDTETGTSVRIPYGDSAHAVEWTYDAQRGAYQRHQAGRDHRDANGKVVEAENVVVLQVRSRVLDGVGRLAIPAFEPKGFVLGTEAQHATVLTAGTRTDGKWWWLRRSTPLPPTSGSTPIGISFLPNGADADAGIPLLTLRPGRTWVEVVDFPMP